MKSESRATLIAVVLMVALPVLAAVLYVLDHTHIILNASSMTDLRVEEIQDIVGDMVRDLDGIEYDDTHNRLVLKDGYVIFQYKETPIEPTVKQKKDGTFEVEGGWRTTEQGDIYETEWK